MPPSPSQSARRIAVVEDDEAVLHSLEFALGAEGYLVYSYKTARDALDSDDIAAADGLIVDYALPDFNGMVLLRALAARGVKAPAVVIASTPSARCRNEAAAAGVPLIEKPLTGDVLGLCLRTLLDGGEPAAGRDGGAG